MNGIHRHTCKYIFTHINKIINHFYKTLEVILPKGINDIQLLLILNRTMAMPCGFQPN